MVVAIMSEKDSKYSRELAEEVESMILDSGIQRGIIASECNISLEYLRQISKLGRKVSPKVLIKIAEVVGGDANKLLVVAGYEPINLTELTEQTTHNLRMFKGAKRPSNAEIEEAKAKIIAEFDKLMSDNN